MGKLNKNDLATLRAGLYSIIEEAFDGKFEHEATTKGRMVTIPTLVGNYYATINVTVHNPEKFDVEEVRHDYLTKLEAAAQRSAKKAEKDRARVQNARNK